MLKLKFFINVIFLAKRKIYRLKTGNMSINKIKIEAVNIHFTKKRLKLIKAVKKLRVITLLIPILIVFLTPLEYSKTFKWIPNTIAFLGLLILLLWIIFSIILYYYPVSYSTSKVLEFNHNSKSISIFDLKTSNHYSINNIKAIYSKRVRCKINILISDYIVHNNFIYLFVYLNNGSYKEFCIKRDNTKISDFLDSLKNEGIEVKRVERFTLFS
jgi:hypothetical protein